MMRVTFDANFCSHFADCEVCGFSAWVVEWDNQNNSVS